MNATHISNVTIYQPLNLSHVISDIDTQCIAAMYYVQNCKGRPWIWNKGKDYQPTTLPRHQRLTYMITTSLRSNGGNTRMTVG